MTGKYSLTRILVLLVVGCALVARAEVKPNSVFASGMVLQRNIAIPVWGTAGDGEEVTVEFRGQKVSTVARDGRWELKLQPVSAGGPFTMTISGKNTVTFTNVLVGEVWVCSGQSNMAFQLARASNAAEAIAAAKDDQLRLCSVAAGNSDVPLADAPVNWRECSPGTASNFSAVAYFFGRDLRKALGVPVGLIQSAVGGTPAEAWTPKSALTSVPDLKPVIERQEAEIKAYNPQRAVAARKAAVEKAKAEGKAPPARLPGVDPARNPKRNSCLYNAMIAPIEPYPIAGVIWYQGEANSGRAAEYRILFPTMIKSWREAWKQGDFPFLFVQIAPHEKMSPEVREAQLYTSQKVPRTAMAVTADVGEETDIHPKQKEPVGARLALAARAVAYGEKIEYSGPEYASMKVEDNRAILTFAHTGRGLMAKSGDLKGFTVAGSDGVFHDATAAIEGDKIVVSSSEVPKPAVVRYGWENTPKVNLFNKDGIPASPFRTDAP